MLSATAHAMYTLEPLHGRLVGARVTSLKNLERAEVYSGALLGVLRALAPRRMVLCADHRAVAIYTPEVSERLVRLFQSVNPQLERAALLVARTNATMMLQLGRLVREAQNPVRKVFHDAPEARAWLSEVLDPAERAALERFLAGSA